MKAVRFLLVEQLRSLKPPVPGFYYIAIPVSIDRYGLEKAMLSASSSIPA
jgi:hypothetical protein